MSTDPATSRSNGGSYLYTENVQVQGYTNQGNIIGDSFGREGKGGQAWATYHLSPHELLQASFRNLKVAKDFIPQGTSQNSFDLRFLKLVGKQLEISGVLQQEWWKAPVYQLAPQRDISLTVQVKWFPCMHSAHVEDSALP